MLPLFGFVFRSVGHSSSNKISKKRRSRDILQYPATPCRELPPAASYPVFPKKLGSVASAGETSLGT